MSFRPYVLFLILLLLSSGCGLREQRKQLQQELADLRQKEQELVLKEQELDARESILNDRQKTMDSVLVAEDTLSSLYPMVPGVWTARMVNTETTCPGAALGDTKVEQWAIYFENNRVIVKAMNNRMELSRIYTGSIDAEGQFNLVAQIPGIETEAGAASKIVVQLKLRGEGSMSGQREIIQSGNCHIVYSLDLKRQK